MKELREKAKLTDLEKADCLTGKMIGGIALKAPGWGGGKRRRFVFSDRTSCYHAMSRVTGGELLFGDVEKEAFRKLMRRMERFSGVEVLTYAVILLRLNFGGQVGEPFPSFASSAGAGKVFAEVRKEHEVGTRRAAL